MAGKGHASHPIAPISHGAKMRGVPRSGTLLRPLAGEGAF